MQSLSPLFSRMSANDSVAPQAEITEAGASSLGAADSPATNSILAAANSNIVPGCVHRAERYIQQHLTEDIRLDDIVTAAGVPARTLHYSFRRFRSSTPMRWLRHRRFEQARQDLLMGAREGVQVIDIAHRYWMHHGGRFAINYQKLFGETPSATLRSALKSS